MKYPVKKERLETDLKWLEERNNALNDYGLLIRHLLNEVDELKQLTIAAVVVNEVNIANDKSILDEPEKLWQTQDSELENSEVELCECNWPLIRTGTKERPEYCGDCGKDIYHN